MKTVLVVDDEIAIAEVLEAILADAGYRAIVASNGKQALERINEDLPDLILTDFMMPVLGGAGLITALNARSEHRRIPVIMMSSLPESAIKGRCDGYAAFLRKPFKINDVHQIVKNIFGGADGAEPT
jgi:two-component system, chemotaxis family, chemotaxis protein CheY